MKQSHKFFIGAIVSAAWVTFWTVFNTFLQPHDYNTRVLFAFGASFIVLGLGAGFFCLANGVECTVEGQ